MADKITHIDGSYHYAEELPKHPTPPAPVTASEGAMKAAAQFLGEYRNKPDWTTWIEPLAQIIDTHTRAADGDGVLRDANWWQEQCALADRLAASNMKMLLEKDAMLTNVSSIAKTRLARAESAERTIAALQKELAECQKLIGNTRVEADAIPENGNLRQHLRNYDSALCKP